MQPKVPIWQPKLTASHQIGDYLKITDELLFGFPKFHWRPNFWFQSPKGDWQGVGKMSYEQYVWTSPTNPPGATPKFLDRPLSMFNQPIGSQRVMPGQKARPLGHKANPVCPGEFSQACRTTSPSRTWPSLQPAPRLTCPSCPDGFAGKIPGLLPLGSSS